MYRARDLRLQRDVAIKILPPDLAGNPDFKQRFEREARALAALSHPHICPVFDVGQQDGIDFLVMEYLEGETLADRLTKGPLPIEQALRHGIEIASALDKAHRHGIVHRDLKPANVMLTKGGAKVLDFGLAKLGEGSAASHAALSHSPTMSPAMSGAGVILGTAAYMAPEQARGKAVDKRADIWAFGCVLYEMLTGRAPFTGEDVSDTLANVLKREPDWRAVPDDVPAAIRALLKRCLEKDPRRRITGIAAALFAMDEATTLGAATPVTPAVDTRRAALLWRVGVPALALVAGATIAGAVAYVRFVPPVAPEMRLQITTPSAGAEILTVSFAMSPDGQNVVFETVADRTAQLWIRSLASENARPLAGTEEGIYPFWSPDGRAIGFFADQKLKRVDIAGGTPQTLAEAPRPYGATWNRDGTILFAGSNTSPLYRVPAIGGQPPVPATRLDSPGQASHRFPHFLPDGRRFLFFVTGAPEVQGVYLGSLDSAETRRLVSASTAAVFLPPDDLLFGRDEALYAQRVDPESMRPVGDLRLVAERVVHDPSTFGSVAATTSTAGTFAYRAPIDASRELTWVDRAGKQIGGLGKPEGLTVTMPRLSPDGQTAIVQRTVGGNTDVWLVDTARGVFRRLTFDPANDSARGGWSPDGLRVLVFSARKKGGGVNDVYATSINGGSDELLLESAENKNSWDWSPDGRFIVYSSQNPVTASDIWALPLDGDRKPFVLVQTNFNELGGFFSPDGHWLSYMSNETGRNENFVQQFPPTGRAWQISVNGGLTIPQWRGDGRELFYIASDNRMMAVPVSTNQKGPSVDVGTAVPLFTVPSGSTSTVTPDGQRFLINTGESSTPPITLVLNWAGRNR